MVVKVFYFSYILTCFRDGARAQQQWTAVGDSSPGSRPDASAGTGRHGTSDHCTNERVHRTGTLSNLGQEVKDISLSISIPALQGSTRLE